MRLVHIEFFNPVIRELNEVCSEIEGVSPVGSAWRAVYSKVNSCVYGNVHLEIEYEGSERTPE